MLAGPGSGKTVALTLRVVRLLQENEDASALALTFTNKAAAEMRDRVDRRLGEHTDRARLCTFHSFAIDILGQHGSHLGIRPDFQLWHRTKTGSPFWKRSSPTCPDGDAELPPDRAILLHLIDRRFSESYGGDGPSSSLTTTPPWLPPLFRRYEPMPPNALVEAVHEPGSSTSAACSLCGRSSPPREAPSGHRLIGHRRDSDPRLVTTRKTVAVREAVAPYAETVRQAVVGNQTEEAEYVGRDIRERGLAPADCAVLGRTNRLVRLVRRCAPARGSWSIRAPTKR